MKILLCMLVAALTFCGTTLASEETTSPPKSKISAPPKAKDMEQPTPIDEKRAICDVCKCDAKTKTVDCEDLKLQTTFTAVQWQTLANTTTTSVDTVRLDNNLIREVPAFPKLAIRVLNLRENRIIVIAKNAFRELADLEVLDLSSNQLTYDKLIPEVFEGKYDATDYEPLKKLKTLDLSKNHLHSLDSDVFEHLSALETLSLSGNPFVVLDHGTTIAISSIAHLKSLDLSFMELSRLPSHILHTPRELRTLNLAGNLFAYMPDALAYAINLEELNLDENIFHSLEYENIFPAMPKLQSLSVSYVMPLTQVGSSAFSGLTGLRKLMCHNNPHLSTFHTDAFKRLPNNTSDVVSWPHLEELHLQNNNLSVIDEHLLDNWANMSYIDIRTNPWLCDCVNQWLLDQLMPKIVKQTGFISSQLLCDHPAEMIGQELSVLVQKGTKMRCSDRYGNRPERDGPLLIGLLIGLLVGIPIAFATFWVWRRGCFGLLGRAGPGAADYSRAFYKRADMTDTDLRVHI